MHHVRKNIPLVIAIIILLVAVGVVIFILRYVQPTYETPGTVVIPTQEITNQATDTANENIDDSIETVIILAPQANSLVTTPLVIQGQAIGTWFFEAALPLQIMDANNTIIGKGVASAQADWMTENLVPFVGTIEFTTPATPTGWIVIRANNPSGLPENDDEFRMPVRFE